ncbi:MAG: AtpZ/AtpI family protein [Alphaproteobacteria bacterium]|nr:MAG: AtpZ/AtpI family protein [Alphaproteobacteria bacterium]
MVPLPCGGRIVRSRGDRPDRRWQRTLQRQIAMDDRDKASSPASFEERLKRARERGKGPEGGGSGQRSDLGMAMRMSLEIVTGVAAGGLIGWGFDQWLGTAPWFLLAFVLLGAMAGIRNVIRIAAEVERGSDDVKDENGASGRNGSRSDERDQ